jgi:serine/threonine protein kinase
MATKKAIDFLNKLLEIDERKRLTAAQALMHPYFKDLLS